MYFEIQGNIEDIEPVVSFTAPFSRNENEIVFSSVRKDGVEGWNVIQPILDAWKKREKSKR